MNNEIIYRFIRSECDEEECLYVINYFEKNFSDIYERLSEEDWSIFLAKYNSYKKQPVEEGHSGLYNKVYNRAITRPRNRKKILKIVASIAALFLLIYLPLTFNFQQDADKTIKIENFVKINSSDSVQYIRLTDGSFAILQPGSKITYSSVYNKDKRDIFLQGVAEFDVSKNPQKPFTVYCNEISVKALGTVFTVNGAQKNTIIYLKEGRIKVESTQEKVIKSQILNKGESIAYLKDMRAFTSDIRMALDKKDIIEAVKPQSKIITKAKGNYSTEKLRNQEKGLVLFKNKNLKNVFSLLANKYEVEIDYPTNIASGVNVYLSVDTTQSVDIILNSIAELNDLKVNKISHSKYIILKK